MKDKLNKVVHDPRTETIYISIRPKTLRHPETSLEYPGRLILDLDAEGDIHGIRLMKVNPEEVDKIMKLLKADRQNLPGNDQGDDETEKI